MDCGLFRVLWIANSVFRNALHVNRGVIVLDLRKSVVRFDDSTALLFLEWYLKSGIVGSVCLCVLLVPFACVHCWSRLLACIADSACLPALLVPFACVHC